MSQFNETPKSGKILTEEEINKLETGDIQRKTLADKLAEKGREKGYRETYQTRYNASKFWLFVICGLYVVTAAPFLYFLLDGHFYFLGETVSMCIAGGLTLLALVVVEWLRWENAASLFFGYFFKNKKIAREKIAFAAFFTALTAALSILGIPKTVDFFLPAPAKEHFSAQTPDEVRAIFEPQIASSKEAAASFHAATSDLQGKLSPKNSRRYSEKLEATSKIQSEMSAALDRLDKANASGKIEISQANTAAVRAHDQKVQGFSTTMVWVICGLEIVFWYLFFFKEKFERFAYVELDKTGQLPSPKAGGPNPNGNGGKKPENGKMPAFLDQRFQNGGTVVQLRPEASQNEIVLHPVATVVQNVYKSVDHLLNYWDRCLLAENRKVAEDNWKRVEEHIEGLKKAGFHFRINNEDAIIEIFSPEATAVESRVRGNRVRGIVFPIAEFKSAQPAKAAAA